MRGPHVTGVPTQLTQVDPALDLAAQRDLPWPEREVALERQVLRPLARFHTNLPRRKPNLAKPIEIGVLLAAKRDEANLICRVAVHPGHRRQGHGRHLMASLSAKLAILGPRRLLAEVPEDDAEGRAFVEACDYRSERVYTDFVLESSAGGAEFFVDVASVEAVTCPTAPPCNCVTRCEGDINGDYSVNSQDIVEVIINWGDCP